MRERKKQSFYNIKNRIFFTSCVVFFSVLYINIALAFSNTPSNRTLGTRDKNYKCEDASYDDDSDNTLVLEGGKYVICNRPGYTGNTCAESDTILGKNLYHKDQSSVNDGLWHVRKCGYYGWENNDETGTIRNCGTNEAIGWTAVDNNYNNTGKQLRCKDPASNKKSCRQYRAAYNAVGTNAWCLFTPDATEKCGMIAMNYPGQILMCLTKSGSSFYADFWKSNSTTTSWDEFDDVHIEDCSDKSDKRPVALLNPSDRRQIYMHNNINFVDNVNNPKLQITDRSTYAGLIVDKNGYPFASVTLCTDSGGSYPVGHKVCNINYICLACPGDLEYDKDEPDNDKKCKCPEGKRLKRGSTEECEEIPEPGPEPEPPAPPEPPEKKCEPRNGVECAVGNYVFEPELGDSSVWTCDPKTCEWSEVDMCAWCCDKKCSVPKSGGYVDAGVWDPATGHHLFVKSGARRGTDAYLFKSDMANLTENCTACPKGTKYNSKQNKCM